LFHEYYLITLDLLPGKLFVSFGLLYNSISEKASIYFKTNSGFGLYAAPAQSILIGVK